MESVVREFKSNHNYAEARRETIVKEIHRIGEVFSVMSKECHHILRDDKTLFKWVMERRPVARVDPTYDSTSRAVDEFTKTHGVVRKTENHTSDTDKVIFYVPVWFAQRMHLILEYFERWDAMESYLRPKSLTSEDEYIHDAKRKVGRLEDARTQLVASEATVMSMLGHDFEMAFNHVVKMLGVKERTVVSGSDPEAREEATRILDKLFGHVDTALELARPTIADKMRIDRMRTLLAPF